MKKIILSAAAVLTIGSLSASASDIKFYVDDQGQLFTTKAEGRVEFKKPHTPVFAKSSKLKFSGVHYLGLTQKSVDGQDSTTNFELRRNYIQVKAYLLEDPKSYFRVTLDTSYTASSDGHADIYAKYAYIYLNDVLPFTGVEFGMAHRPWMDYEEHQGWLNRSLSKVFSEASEAGHLMNSADLGVNFKTKTPYFTSEVGVFNGEGYHGENGEDSVIGDGLSAEWRFTAAIMGNGKSKRKATKDTYFDASFFGQLNMDNAKNSGETFKVYGLHTVYNMPSFLVAAQYIMADNDKANDDHFNGQGYSINGEYRFGAKKEYSVLGRYDAWENEDSTSGVVTTTESNAIYGFAWKQNKNLKWLVSGQTYNVKENNTKDYSTAMLTAEVHW